jgi:integrase
MPRHKKQARREKGEGGLYQRADGRWCAVLDLAREFPGGPRRRKVFYGETRDDAREKRMAWQVGAKATYTDDEPHARGTLGELLEYWITNVKLNLTDGSVRAYRICITHLKPLAGKQLDKLTHKDIQTHIARLTRARSSYVARRVLSKLRQVLDYALKTDRVRRNEALRVEAPRHTRRKAVPLTREQALAFIETVAGHTYEVAFWLSLSGLRSGEVRGAKWADVDWRQGAIQVERQARQITGGSELGKTKTEKSVRLVFLPDQAMAALRFAREAWLQTAIARTPDARDLLVVSKRGKILPATTYSAAFAAVLKRAGIPHTKLHDMRHTFATLAIDAGASPAAVQAQLGHAHPDMTFAYTHPTTEGQQRAAGLYGEAIKKRAK